MISFMVRNIEKIFKILALSSFKFIKEPRSCIEWRKEGEKGKLLQLVNINQQSK